MKDSLMNLAMTNEAGAVYNTYLNSFKNEDGSVNWLPVCADAHGFVVNRSLFEQYDIPLPTDYASFVAACQAFEKVGIRGFTSDYTYDYTCMETLQGLSAAELTTTDGASGALLTATLPAPNGWVWTTPCGRGRLSGWRSSFRIPTLQQMILH